MPLCCFHISDYIEISDLIGSLLGALLGFLGAYWILRIEQRDSKGTEALAVRNDLRSQYDSAVTLFKKALPGWSDIPVDYRRLADAYEQDWHLMHEHVIQINISQRTLEALDRNQLRSCFIQLLGPDKGERLQGEFLECLDVFEEYRDFGLKAIVGIKEDITTYTKEFEELAHSMLLMMRDRLMLRNVQQVRDPTGTALNDIYQRTYAPVTRGNRPDLRHKVDALINPVLNLGSRTDLNRIELMPLLSLGSRADMARQRIQDSVSELVERSRHFANELEKAVKEATTLLAELQRERPA